MNVNVNERLKGLSADKGFLKELFEQDSPEKIQAKFAERGVELSLDEVKELVVAVVDAAETHGTDELNEDSLEDVAGGVVLASLIGWGVMALMTAGGIAVGWKLAKNKC